MNAKRQYFTSMRAAATFKKISNLPFVEESCGLFTGVKSLKLKTSRYDAYFHIWADGLASIDFQVFYDPGAIVCSESLTDDERFEIFVDGVKEDLAALGFTDVFEPNDVQKGEWTIFSYSVHDINDVRIERIVTALRKIVCGNFKPKLLAGENFVRTQKICSNLITVIDKNAAIIRLLHKDF